MIPPSHSRHRTHSTPKDSVLPFYAPRGKQKTSLPEVNTSEFYYHRLISTDIALHINGTKHYAVFGVTFSPLTVKFVHAVA